MTQAFRASPVHARLGWQVMARQGHVELRGLTLPIYNGEVRTILSRTSGFIARAGFTHSLNPARNCLYGCTYCYGADPQDLWGAEAGRLAQVGAPHNIQEQRAPPCFSVNCAPGRSSIALP